jgi:hypothetical protein
MHARSFFSRPHGLRPWIAVAVVLAVLGVMALVRDSRDLGDGLVQGSAGSVSTAWDSAQGGVDDFLFGSPSTRRAEPGR